MTIKIDFEFKKGDYIELTGMSEVQVGAILKHFEDLDYKTDWFSADLEDATGLCVELDTIWLNRFTTEDVTGMEDVRKLTIKDIFPTIEQEHNTDLENCKTTLEELGCQTVTVKVENKGNTVYEGVIKDSSNMTHDVQYNELPFDLQDPTTWHCFKEVADVIGEEDAEYELGKVLLQINDGEIVRNSWGYPDELDLENDDLDSAFNWEETVQGHDFWENICEGNKPEGYDSTPDTPPTPEVDKKAKPSLKIPDSALGDIKETFTETHSQTLGELVEAIQTNIPPHIGIHFQPDGEVLLECDNVYVVVSELTAKEIDSAIEFVAHYGHLVIGKNIEE